MSVLVGTDHFSAVLTLCPVLTLTGSRRQLTASFSTAKSERWLFGYVHWFKYTHSRSAFCELESSLDRILGLVIDVHDDASFSRVAMFDSDHPERPSKRHKLGPLLPDGLFVVVVVKYLFSPARTLPPHCTRIPLAICSSACMLLWPHECEDNPLDFHCH